MIDETRSHVMSDHEEDRQIRDEIEAAMGLGSTDDEDDIDRFLRAYELEWRYANAQTSTAKKARHEEDSAPIVGQPESEAEPRALEATERDRRGTDTTAVEANSGNSAPHAGYGESEAETDDERRPVGAEVAKPTTQPDPREIKQFLAALYRPGDVVEVRVPHAHRGVLTWRDGAVISGYFDDGRALLRSVQKTTGRDADGVYITLNPVNPALFARAANRLKETGQRSSTTADADILRRTNLLIDVDPVRASGISSTAEEQDAALTVRDSVRAFLVDLGWPPPSVVGASGNGGALIYRVDLPNDPAATELVRGCLDATARLFNTNDVKIDTSVHNAARVTKLYGTVAAKGDATPDRPWRRARATYNPDAPPVTRAQLEAFAALMSEAATKDKVPSSPSGSRSWTVPEVLQKAGIAFDQNQAPYATIYRLRRCLTSGDHTDGACILEFANGAVGYRCQHDSCADKRWPEARAALGDAIPRDGQISGDGGANAADDADIDRAIDERPWPDPLAPEAFHGLAGEIIHIIEPHTEADPAALLIQLLVAFGNATGRSAHFIVEADRHYLNSFALLVGLTSKGRKGTSWGHVGRIFEAADPEWTNSRLMSGLSSGEGLIWAVRDPITKTVEVKEGRKPTGEFRQELVDAGIDDKRMLALESEYGAVLKIITREGNTLSALVRQAWDTGSLRSLTKNNPAQATGAHISIIGHITSNELRSLLTETDAANGFGNRHLYVCTRRSKCLPRGGHLREEDLQPLIQRLTKVLDYADQASQLTLDEEAWQRWEEVYPVLSEGKPGLVGALTSRAEAQTLRLAACYALLDRSTTIQRVHLDAGLAIWRYCEASAKYIFGDATGNSLADKILAELRKEPDGMTRTDIRDFLGRNEKGAKIGHALKVLLDHALARRVIEPTDGRPAERWFALAQVGEPSAAAEPTES
jgi:hypothetical protein